MTPDDDARLAVRPDHREYVRELFEAGSIRMSGPFADETGAYLVYSAADEADARSLIERDPYVVAGVVEERSLREWVVIYPED